MAQKFVDIYKGISVGSSNNTIIGYQYYKDGANSTFTENNGNGGRLREIHYANDFSVRYVYDKIDNIKEVWYTNGNVETKAFEYSYVTSGRLYRFDNLLTHTAIGDAGRIANKIDTVSDVRKTVGNAVDTASNTAKQLRRPYIRKSTRKAVESAAKRAPDGRFLDANTGDIISGKYDLGHVDGHEFWRERNMAMSHSWTQKQFNNYMNNPDFYRIEDPHWNRSHKFEMPRN